MQAINKRDFNVDRTICNAATAGPWDFGVHEDGRHVIHDSTYFGRHIAEIVSGGVESEQREEDNATFIAEARSGWPAALDEIERLRRHMSLRTFNGQYTELEIYEMEKEALNSGGG